MIYHATMNSGQIKENLDLKNLTTFSMGGRARWFVAAPTIEELAQAYDFAVEKNLPVFILGSGSNILFSHPGTFEAVVVKIEIKGFEIVSETVDETTLKVGAGEIWDDVVKRAVDMNLSGIEALSAIPGTTGATPIQNVGAYGSEIADVLVSLEVYDLQTKHLSSLSKEQCLFKYRDSIFKHDAKDKYVITAITMKLSKGAPLVPDYPGVKKYFDERNIEHPTLQQIREAIISIRQLKLPDPKQVASVGSFFKNPIVSDDLYQTVKENYPEVVAFPQENGDYKISAGWLLETLGYKGKQIGNLQFYPNSALVLTNVGSATFGELTDLVDKTKAHVRQAFGIELELEPIIV